MARLTVFIDQSPLESSYQFLAYLSRRFDIGYAFQPFTLPQWLLNQPVGW